MNVLTAATSRSASGRHTRQRNLQRLDGAVVAALAAISYVPLLLTQRGMVSADTKEYLYLDPGRLIQSALSMWDPDVGAGTVTHQNIGFLFPMGPYYWVMAQLGVPVWVSQRLWMGTLFFAAGTGVWCAGPTARTVPIGPARGRAGLHALAVRAQLHRSHLGDLDALGRRRVDGGCTILAARRGGWRYPALFALVVALVGGVNATSMLLIGIGPALWLVSRCGARARSTGTRRGRPPSRSAC